MVQWNPEIYDAFAAQRQRPAEDLVAAVPLNAPRRITDLGCGSGLSTTAVARRWPDARLCGLDRSAQMLEEARRRLPAASFAVGEIGDYRAPEPQDLLLANASLHWLAEHETLLPRLLAQLAAGGVLAVQMPRNSDEPSHQLLEELAKSVRFRGLLSEMSGERYRVADPGRYYDWLRPHCAALDIWETRYLHALDSADSIADWFASTALRPYLDALTPETAEEFLAGYREALAGAYPAQRDGRVLLAMPRLFIVAQKPG